MGKTKPERAAKSGRHTPGPWTAVVMGREFTEVGCGEKTPVVNWCGFDDSTRSREEHNANARLISAAPDLLAACEAAFKLIHNRGNIAFMDCTATLRAAISKAKG